MIGIPEPGEKEENGPKDDKEEEIRASGRVRLICFDLLLSLALQLSLQCEIEYACTVPGSEQFEFLGDGGDVGQGQQAKVQNHEDQGEDDGKWAEEHLRDDIVAATQTFLVALEPVEWDCQNSKGIERWCADDKTTVVLIVLIDWNASDDTVVVDAERLVTKLAISVGLDGDHEVEHHDVVDYDGNDDETFTYD